MRLFPYQFNSFSFQKANLIASDWNTAAYDWTISGIATNAISRSQNFPKFSSKNYAGNIKVIMVAMNDVDADRDSLVIAMDVLGEDQHKLISKDELGRLWYVDAVCIGINQEDTDGKVAKFGVIFDVDDPIWKKYIPSTKSMTTFYGSASDTITPLGNQPALPVITITPSGVGSYGFLYKRFIQITNNSPNALNNYPLNLVDTVLDTAALIGAGKMLANGDDLRIYVDGVEVKRWFGGGGINSATTTIWVNWNQPAKSDMTLGTAIAGSGAITTITIENTAENIALLPLIPISGNVLIGTEIFVYTGVNVALRQLTGVTRAERETVEGAHSQGDAVKFITHDVWLYYGNPTIAPYVVDDTYKPIIDLVTSTNTSHVYLEFGSNAGLRTAAWTRAAGGIVLGNGTLYNYYTGSHGLLNTDPWEVMGINGPTDWLLYNPCGINYITPVGEKFYDGYANWNIQFQISTDGTTYAAYFYEAPPGVYSTWVAIDDNVRSVNPPYPYYIKYTGFVDEAFRSASHKYELSSMIIGIFSAKTPTITLAAENNITFNLNTTITNAATGYSIMLDFPISPGFVLIVDTKEKTIKGGDGSNQINALLDMPVRTDWFPLLPAQSNAITITEAGDVLFDFSWEDRSL